ncbi:MAG: sulfite exporter TauE/SafE family protein [Myxococcota bacterium]
MNTSVLLSVLVASFFGSLHCVGMCGGFVAFYSGSGTALYSTHIVYSLGRWVAYAALGAIAGTAGAAVDLAGSAAGLQQAAALVAGITIVLWGGVLLLRHRVKIPTPQWLEHILQRILPPLLKRPPHVRAGVLGVCSALLPCGWLYAFAATAAGTGSAAHGALLMTVFWIGTVPALLGTGLGMRTLSGWLGPKLPLVMPCLLVAIGLMTVAHRYPAFANDGAEKVTPHCHGH